MQTILSGFNIVHNVSRCRLHSFMLDWLEKIGHFL